MKLVRYGPAGAEKPGLIDDSGALRDLSGTIDDINGATLSPDSLARIAGIDHATLPEVPGEPRLGPPVSAIGKVLGVGINYATHAKETGMAIPEEPILFAKQTTAVSGPNDPVMVPKGAVKVDWEAELAVVIGTVARHVAEADALDYVAGYCLANDVSERDFQFKHGPDWQKGKSCDSFGPLGPWLVTADEITDPQNLHLRLAVNGEIMQDSSTDDMIFNVVQLISYISRFMTLMPGDVIITGTPSGVGAGQKPPRFLVPGDVMALSIGGLGEQRQEVIAYNKTYPSQ